MWAGMSFPRIVGGIDRDRGICVEVIQGRVG